jgi:hypothetical protein
MPFTVDFGIDTSVGAFEDYTKRQLDKLQDELFGAIDEINEIMANDLSDAYSGGIVQRRTGAAADSVKVNPATRDGEYIEGSVQAGGDAAPEVEWLEWGTKPHVIYPTEEGGTLAFAIGGDMHFAKYVFHPGTPAYGIFEVVERSVPEWETLLQDAPEQLIG